MRVRVLVWPSQSYSSLRATKSGAHLAIWSESPKCRDCIRFSLDLADRLSIEDAFNSALAEAGYFDVLINNAGAGHFEPAELVPMETITSQFQILVFGQIQLMQLALRHMQARGEGLIINVTSLASRLPVPFMAAYNAAKAAMATFYHVDPARACSFPRADCRSSTRRHSHRIQPGRHYERLIVDDASKDRQNLGSG